MSKRVRQYIGVFAAIVVYYIIHEGAHLAVALYYGVFRKINFMGLGIQIDVHAAAMTELQLGLFCLAGPLAALLAGWLLVLLAKRICTVQSKIFKAAAWYVTLALLILDPLYLSVLCGFFGGGDMNGIALIFPEIPARVIFGVLGIVHGIVVWKYLLGVYTKAFEGA